MTYDAFVVSDVGRVRGHNEDDSLVLPEHGVYVVADGMGGHACGEVASRVSVQSIEEFYTNRERAKSLRAEYRALRAEGGAQEVVSFDEYRLRTAFEYGNAEIFKHASQDEQLADMGTTIVGLAFSKKRVYIAHVGDSRAYRQRRGSLEQLTQDHSLANEFIRMNVLRPEDLPRFPYKNVIVRALGLQQEVVVDTCYRTVKPGDRYLLCSDGLTDLVEDGEIEEILTAIEGPRRAAEALVERALDHGGVDNVTVLITDVNS
ncbi:MAG: Stp1/IreP family PP2C-type Ser/Thr phosphatase [Deltaproteobacteria bacterium]|nr:Stp1/IreP family PP2C-type Ser/Thr phosphatase [Deltaproteobacteria bacterium]MCB9785503.1 Stp1/IreP family PP2C-type Ser/Thr phosphatase [Deltaproteobacteria bacterium]